MNGGSCGSCAYFFTEKTAGCCRKAPPKVFVIGVLPPARQGEDPRPLIQSFWPPVTKAMWCGEYVAKGAPPGAA